MRTRRKVGTLNEGHEIIRCRLGVGKQVQGGIDDFAKVVWRDIGRHTNSDTLGAINQQVRVFGWQDRGLFVGVVVVGREVNGVFINPGHKLKRQGSQARFGVPHCCGAFVWAGATKVSVTINERVAHGEVLDHANQGVVDSRVTVGVVGAHDFTNDLGALGMRPIGTKTLVEH